jgi:hypothetical protein
MIDLTKIYDLMVQAFHKTQDYFKWGDNAIIQGELGNLPAPDEISSKFQDGDYFAIVSLVTVQPDEETGNISLVKPGYKYSIALCHKGKVGDITKLRNDMINMFADGWYSFWSGRRYRLQIENILLSVPDIERDLDIVAVQFIGTISHITAKRGDIHG